MRRARARRFPTSRCGANLAWTLEYDVAARRQLRKLPRTVGDRILTTLEQIAALENPRTRGHALTGDYAGHWRYRVGDYRVVARIDDGRLVIVVIAIGHRRAIYR
ncbi:type II toxin-antitoxin system RelE family toxin [Sphingopyxis indica]|uniref:type II toxin-antitoxin system RelE family toxin n=1 Tax=Sphingopyxis indica TaxID=436663 RepID=UPI001BAF37AA|nr:type II toxin-antitoxin system RelE/ParE family toxin [Sphingopyxis indica]